MVRKCLFLVIFAFVINTFGIAYSSIYKKAILIVSDHSNPQMLKKEEALRRYLAYYRQKYNRNSRSLPIFVYDFSKPAVKKYCEKRLGVTSKDLLLLSIVTTRGKLPIKVHFKVIDPKNVEENAKKIIEKMVGANVFGSLSVNTSPPGAQVWVSSMYRGKTPVRISDLKAGTYNVTIYKKGYVKEKRQVVISGGKTVSLDVSLSLLPREVIITSEPSGADVFIDGVGYGKTPLTLKDLKFGSHKIVMKRGDSQWEGTFEVKKGEKTYVKGELASVSSKINLPQDLSGEDQTDNEEAFVPRTQQNQVFRVTVSNLEEVNSIKDYYRPKPGYKFVVVYVSQQNISNQVQIYSGQFSLLDQMNRSYEPLDRLSNFWVVVLRPGGAIMGYLVFEIPEDSKPMNLVLHGLNMAPLSVSLK